MRAISSNGSRVRITATPEGSLEAQRVSIRTSCFARTAVVDAFFAAARHGEHVVQYERDTFRRTQRLEHNEQ